MKNDNIVGSSAPAQAPSAAVMRFAPFQWLKSKQISYFAIPLIVGATIAEIFILVTGWRYQQRACLPPGMGVTFLGIGPIGATILAVELLKLPLAIWTAARTGWKKAFMLVVGLPMICLLTFQLVKDMAVYEMEVAMKPATEMLEKAAAEENKIVQLKNDLTGIEEKKAEINRARAELEARRAKAKADLEESLKHLGESREDAIALTDYQKKELAEVELRQAAIIKQFDADTDKLNKAIAELRAQREIEVVRAAQWKAEEARLENEYQKRLAEYTNQKTAYLKAQAEYESAPPLKRLLMRLPADPGVPPVRETNTILKPVEIAELDAQIKAKDVELAELNKKRRERVAQVDADARRLREEFDRRSTTRRAEVDQQREQLLAAHAATLAQLATEEKQLNQEYLAAVQRVDGIRNQIDATQAVADRLYEAREKAIQNTQVHRIATTVEIIRGLLMGQRPVSITATAKQRGDLYTDQISMVRVWVYPVLAFVVAFLPALMVEIGFSTLFQPEKQRPPHRLGFLGRRMHALYQRAGRLKILRAERLAKEATAAIAQRDKAWAATKADLEKRLADADAELRAARAATEAAVAQQQELLQKKEDAWVAKYTELADSLNRAVAEKDALRDFQKAEIERQIQQRQKAWSDRITQLRQELDEQRAASEAERAALMTEHHQKLKAVTEAAQAQVSQARRQLAEAELKAVEKVTQLMYDRQEALQARDAAEAALRRQTAAVAQQVAQAKEDTAREFEKVLRQEKLRADRLQAEHEEALRQREEELALRFKQREQELTAAFDARLMEERAQAEQAARRREADLEQQAEARVRELNARWQLELQQQQEAAERHLKQREQQWQAQSDLRLRDAQKQAEQELRRRELEWERQLDNHAREAQSQFRQELQQKEIAFQTQLQQREQEWQAEATARESERQRQLADALRARDQEWERQLAARVRGVESRLMQEMQQREEQLQTQFHQREQQLRAEAEARQTELKAQGEKTLRDREQEWEQKAAARTKELEARFSIERKQREELFQAQLRQHTAEWQKRLETARAEWQTQSEQDRRRQEQEATAAREGALRELETRLRGELQAQYEAAQAQAKKREQDLTAQLLAATEAQRAAEQERDKARHYAAGIARQIRDMKSKLIEASALVMPPSDGTSGEPVDLANLIVR